MPAADRTCAITGATSGIGLACAVTFARAGYHVAICRRHPDRLAMAKSHIKSTAGDRVKVVTCAVDLTTPLGGQQFVESALADLGHLDVLVNNAGIAPSSPLDQFQQETFEQTYALNIRAVYQTVRAAWDAMKQHGGATIVNISSRAAVESVSRFQRLRCQQGLGRSVFPRDCRRGASPQHRRVLRAAGRSGYAALARPFSGLSVRPVAPARGRCRASHPPGGPCHAACHGRGDRCP